MLREYKVNITETVMRHIWVVADDPQDAIDIAEQSYSQDETLDAVSYTHRDVYKRQGKRRELPRRNCVGERENSPLYCFPC